MPEWHFYLPQKENRVHFLYWKLYVHNTHLACTIRVNCYFLAFQKADVHKLMTFTCPGQSGKYLCSTLHFVLNMWHSERAWHTDWFNIHFVNNTLFGISKKKKKKIYIQILNNYQKSVMNWIVCVFLMQFQAVLKMLNNYM